MAFCFCFILFFGSGNLESWGRRSCKRKPSRSCLPSPLPQPPTVPAHCTPGPAHFFVPSAGHGVGGMATLERRSRAVGWGSGTSRGKKEAPPSAAWLPAPSPRVDAPSGRPHLEPKGTQVAEPRRAQPALRLVCFLDLRCSFLSGVDFSRDQPTPRSRSLVPMCYGGNGGP